MYIPLNIPKLFIIARQVLCAQGRFIRKCVHIGGFVYSGSHNSGLKLYAIRIFEQKSRKRYLSSICALPLCSDAQPRYDTHSQPRTFCNIYAVFTTTYSKTFCSFRLKVSTLNVMNRP